MRPIHRARVVGLCLAVTTVTLTTLTAAPAGEPTVATPLRRAAPGRLLAPLFPG